MKPPRKTIIADLKNKLPKSRIDIDIETNLPPSHCRGIGRIAFKHAVLEYQLSQFAYLLIGVDRRIGRIAVRDPRTEELIDMINQLLELREMEVAPISNEVKTAVRKAKQDRDLVAHGNWVLVDGVLHVVSTRGTVPVSRFQKDGRSPRSERPVSFEVTLSTLKEVADSIDSLLLTINQSFAQAFAELETSPEKLRAPPHPKSRTPDQNSGT